MSIFSPESSGGVTIEGAFDVGLFGPFTMVEEDFAIFQNYFGRFYICYYFDSFCYI